MQAIAHILTVSFFPLYILVVLILHNVHLFSVTDSQVCKLPLWGLIHKSFLNIWQISSIKLKNKQKN